MTPQQKSAVAYCQSLDLNPFEEVWGMLIGTRWMKMPRWQWHIGAVVEGAA